MTELESEVLAAVDDDAVVDLLARLVAARSENPPGAEAAAAAVLAARLGDAGIPAVLNDVAPGRPNLEASYGGDEGPSLLLNGHTDTMPAGEGWSTQPFEPVVREGRLYGLGACDMKAGVAAMAEAVIAVKQAGMPLLGRVILDAVVDEEAGGSGTKRTIARGRRADWAVITEPTEFRVLRLGNGQVNFDVRFQGQAGHGSTPEAGHNAIYDAAAFVAEIECEAALLARRPHPLIGPPSYSVGRVEGGLRTSIIPAACRVGVDRRTIPGQAVADAVADLDAVLQRILAARPGARAERAIEVEYEPFEVPESLPVCEALREATCDVTGRDLPFGGLRATTDAAFLVEAGTPTVIFGPGSIEQAHRPDEWVSLEQVRQAARVLALTIVRLLA